MPPKAAREASLRGGGRGSRAGAAAKALPRSSSPRSGRRPAAERLRALGWAFSQGDGLLRSVKEDTPYSVETFEGDYETLAAAISDAVVEQLRHPPESLEPVSLPELPSGWAGTARGAFASAGAAAHGGALLVLIPGITCRAGVWSRSLCATGGLEIGFMRGYLRAGRERGMAQLVLDPNSGADPSDGELHTRHCVHALRHWIERSRAAELYIVAHSYGGASLIDMLAAASESTLAKIQGIAFTDSVHHVGPGCLQLVEGRATLPPLAEGALRRCGTMWQADGSPVDTVLWPFNSDRGCRVVSAGAEGHAETNAAACEAIFRHFAAPRPRGGALRAARPVAVAEASRRKFAEQESAGRSHSYGAVGELDYSLTGCVWDCATGEFNRRQRIFGLSELLTVLRQAHGEDFSSLRFLDLGCGDGQSLWSMHKDHGLPWTQVVGITAEDMRGVEVLDGQQPFDLRAVAGPAAESSYVLWNIEELDTCLALRGRTFDVIVSWITWCWLTDPMAALELIYDRFLAPGGVLMLGSLALSTGGDPGEDLRLLLGLRDCLAEADGHTLEVFADEATGVYGWWLQRKAPTGDPPGLRLGRFLRYNEEDLLEESSHKVNYAFDPAVLGLAAAAHAGRPVPSARLRVNEEALDEAARARCAEDLQLHRPMAELDLSSLVSGWLREAPCPLGGGAAESEQTEKVMDMVLAKFREFDISKDGTIDQRDLASVLKKLNSSFWSEAKVRTLISAIDLNKDGRIDLDEFIQWAFRGYSAGNQDVRAFRSTLDAPSVQIASREAPGARGRSPGRSGAGGRTASPRMRGR